MKIKINKSTRHSKITGDFAEGLVLYLLSKHGFECANVDHTGIDIIAKNPVTKEVMGISVKSRSRTEGTEGTSLSISNDNFEKVDSACKAFGCVPYFAFLIDEDSTIKLYILKKEHLLTIFPKGLAVVDWRMSPEWIQKYKEDKNIVSMEFEYRVNNWW